jgi:hypothetical protein
MTIGPTTAKVSYLSNRPRQTCMIEAQEKQIMTSSECIYHEPYAMLPPVRGASDTNCG